MSRAQKKASETTIEFAWYKIASVICAALFYLSIIAFSVNYTRVLKCDFPINFKLISLNPADPIDDRTI